MELRRTQAGSRGPAVQSACRTGSGATCSRDADTRYLLRAEPRLDPTGANVEKVLDSAFEEFGLPKGMRSDNGPPFASTGAGRLSRLSVWWLNLGIQLERIEPGKPQQTGGSSAAT